MRPTAIALLGLCSFLTNTALAETGAGYLTLSSGDRIRTGIARNPWPDVEPNWLVYVYVESVQQTVAEAQRAGGFVLLAPSHDWEDGRIALIEDPTGGVLAIQQRARP